jgi:hypothetical protein
LREIALKTRTTKANVATALQMITWGVRVNAYGNAMLDEQGEFVKVSDAGVPDDLWAEMVAYAKEAGLKGGNYKKLNLPFENKLLGLPMEIRERMVKGVADFVYDLLANVFNAGDTAPLAMEAILEKGSHDLGPKGTRLEDPEDWTKDKIRGRASQLNAEKGPKGDFDD